MFINREDIVLPSNAKSVVVWIWADIKIRYSSGLEV